MDPEDVFFDSGDHAIVCRDCMSEVLNPLIIATVELVSYLRKYVKFGSNYEEAPLLRRVEKALDDEIADYLGA